LSAVVVSRGEPAARLARVERVVAAARRVADPADPLGAEARRRLPTATGLSPEGVELALAEHLETAPAAEELEALVAGAGSAPSCDVVLSANVCVAALRAIAVAVATAPAVRVRPSRRDPVLAELLVRALADEAGFGAAGGAIALAGEVAARAGDELHVYGADATISALRAAVAPGVVVRGHGTGLGLAVVGPAAPLREAALAVARDVVPFDQRGCLSPRIVLVDGPAARAEAFARALDEALAGWDARVPRGALDAAAEGEIAQYRATLEAIGEVRVGAGHAVGLDPSPRALVLAPAARVVHVVAATGDDVARLVSPLADLVAALGHDGGGRVVEACAALAPGARRSALGRMQRPPLDGPVDLRVR
jgi:hypothetical protein